MESLLADVVLSNCGDYAALIDRLSAWDATGPCPPTPESLEVLRIVIQRVATDCLQESTAVPLPLTRSVTDLALGRCLPLLTAIFEKSIGSRDITRVTRTVCAVLRHCAEIAGCELAERVCRIALDSLKGQWNEQRTLHSAGEGTARTVPREEQGKWTSAPEAKAGEMSVVQAIEVLGAVVPTVIQLSPVDSTHDIEQVIQTAVSLLREGTDEAANLLCGRLMPSLAGDSRSLKLLLEQVISDVVLQKGDAGICLSRRLLVLSTLSDQLFSLASPDGIQDSWCSRSFWRSVQEGMSCPDSLTRKRAVYMLKRAVDWCQDTRANLACNAEGCAEGEPALFFWSADDNKILVEFWENFILIIETLEGNQIHVIKPVLPKLNFLFDSAVLENKDLWFFHPSWHLCIYKRMFESENKTLAKEGILHFFEIYCDKSLPGSTVYSEFIIGPLMDAMSESAIYGRSAGQPSDSCPLLGAKFETFLGDFVSSLPEETRGGFLLKLIKKMTSRNWCAVPVLFISKALSALAPCKAWGVEGLLPLREVLQCTMTTHQILLRGAAQCFLLQAVMKLTHVEKVSFSDISSFLMFFRPEESLHRGSKLWKELCIWLHNNDGSFRRSAELECFNALGKSSLTLYTQSLIQDYLKVPALTEDKKHMPDGFESRLVATMVLLAADVEILKNSEVHKSAATPTEVKCFLDPLLETLSKLSTNAYMPTLKSDRSLQLLLQLLQTCSSNSFESDGLLVFLWDSVMIAATSTMEFILRRLSGELNTIPDLQRCDLYLAVFSEFVRLSSRLGWKRGPSIWSFAFSLMKNSLQVLQQYNGEQNPKVADQIQKVVSMATMASVCGAVSSVAKRTVETHEFVSVLHNYFSSVQLNKTLTKPHITDESFLEEGNSQGWGKIVARYLHDQWLCMYFVLKNDNLLSLETVNQALHNRNFQTATTTLQVALDALSVIPSHQALPVFKCLKLLLPKVIHSSESLCVESIHLAWKIVSSLCGSQLAFWPHLNAFVELVFSEEVLSHAASTKSEVFVQIKKIIQQIIDLSSTKMGVYYVFVSHCCQTWIENSVIKDSALHYAKHYMEILLEACTYGTVFRRDQRLIQDTHAFIESLGEDCAANVAVKSINRDEHYVRTAALRFLCLLDGSNSLHKAFLEDFIVRLLDKDVLVSKSKTRYYGNSLQHRVKNRLWQTILILIPKLDQDFVSGIIERIFQAGFSNNQASVKYLIEWTLILILHTYPNFLQQFWDCFCCSEEQLKTSICTFLSVLPHFDVILEKVSDKLPSLKKALVTVLQWCFSHNFSVRLYALIALKKLWSLCKQQYSQEFETLSSIIESSLHQLENLQGGGNARKNWLRIQEHFFFSTFHPLEDYSIETIFYTLPSVSELIEDEWIPYHKFSVRGNMSWKLSVPLTNSRTMVFNQKPNDWLQQDIGTDGGDVDNHIEWADIQKKIIPWKNSIPDLDLDMVLQHRAAKLGKSNGSLIVIASLIDKPTNLGGLCRTCEIFGASALVVDSLHHVNDKQFQYLSVSAEQWLPLVEVKPSQLIGYLQLKKAQGYTIIGVEQTAKSVDLTEYSFPEKSLLLLGNEREGIPANLIQHLDVCVEIPQQGIIRSLNVHVSGAVLIWEYTRQHILKQKAT
ncbi:probable methyltransferase TARBP1 [Spea bombifrons]|uniref:probable methyltransferase TARBP1 n=1 Tax=Spea bombifrons TaxID=233779 RepID=UPI00234AA75F|nr:probable methyltransferase TARBP1 [Spea bombifrons]